LQIKCIYNFINENMVSFIGMLLSHFYQLTGLLTVCAPAIIEDDEVVTSVIDN